MVRLPEAAHLRHRHRLTAGAATHQPPGVTVPHDVASLLAQGGAVSAMALFCYRLLRTMLAQANAHAEHYRAAAEAADKRADETVRLLGEVLSVMRSVQDLVRAGRDTMI